MTRHQTKPASQLRRGDQIVFDTGTGTPQTATVTATGSNGPNGILVATSVGILRYRRNDPCTVVR